MALKRSQETSKHLDFAGFITREEAGINHLSQTFVVAGQAGCKMIAEFIHYGHYASLYDSCKQDLDDVENSLRGIPKEKYNIVRLAGYDDVCKDKEIGLRAIQDNVGIIKEKFISDTRIQNSDFTWIVVSLGEGIGSGSIGIISQIVSYLMRMEQRYKRHINHSSGKVIHHGFPTTGIIAAIPEQDATYMVKLSAVLALKEIEKLQQNNLIGTVLVIDNDKLINDFIKKPSRINKESKNTDWVTFENTTAQLLTEIAALTSLQGREILSKADIYRYLVYPIFSNYR